jgi:hypothetical protein
VGPWTEPVEVSLPLVSFQTVYVFEANGAGLVSESTLRFRDQDEIEQSLSDAGFRVEEGREAPDRPGLEMVFIARKEHRPGPGPGSAGQTAAVPLASARSDVQRLGAVVARKAGPWTPSVHALLSHLEAAGFDAPLGWWAAASTEITATGRWLPDKADRPARGTLRVGAAGLGLKLDGSLDPIEPGPTRRPYSPKWVQHEKGERSPGGAMVALWSPS